MDKKAALKEDVELRPHQERFVNRPGNSAIAAHAVGSGKTLSAIARFERMREEEEARKAIVVVPASLRDNFAYEGVDRFTDSSYNIIGNKQEIRKGTYRDIDPNADYNILSYEMFRTNPSRYFDAIGADTVITDESHRGKNEGTATTDALKASREHYKNYIGLTGSVISNSPADVLPLIDVASGGNHNLGKNKRDFMDRWVLRSQDKRFRNVSPNKRPMVGFRRPNMLKSEIERYVDYIGIEEASRIANMPKKDLDVVQVPLNPDQVRYYKQMLKDDPAVYKLIREKRMDVLGDDEAAKAFNKLIEARKLMNDMGTVNRRLTPEESATVTPKTRRLLDDLENHLESTPDGQAILLSHLINGGTNVLEAGLRERGIPYGTFLGKGNKGVTEELRQQAIEDFKNRKIRAMIISSAGGEGISLGDTTWEGVLDPHFNPERMNQMEARGIRSNGLSHRPDDEREVEVRRYLSTMPKTLGIFKSNLITPDEYIYQIAQRKERENQMLMDLLNKGNRIEKTGGERMSGFGGFYDEVDDASVRESLKRYDRYNPGYETSIPDRLNIFASDGGGNYIAQDKMDGTIHFLDHEDGYSYSGKPWLASMKDFEAKANSEKSAHIPKLDEFVPENVEIPYHKRHHGSTIGGALGGLGLGVAGAMAMPKSIPAEMKMFAPVAGASLGAFGGMLMDINKDINQSLGKHAGMNLETFEKIAAENPELAQKIASEIMKGAAVGFGMQVSQIGDSGDNHVSVGFPYGVGIEHDFRRGKALRPQVGFGLTGPYIGMKHDKDNFDPEDILDQNAHAITGGINGLVAGSLIGAGLGAALTRRGNVGGFLDAGGFLDELDHIHRMADNTTTGLFAGSAIGSLSGAALGRQKDLERMSDYEVSKEAGVAEVTHPEGPTETPQALGPDGLPVAPSPAQVDAALEMLEAAYRSMRKVASIEPVSAISELEKMAAESPELAEKLASEVLDVISGALYGSPDGVELLKIAASVSGAMRGVRGAVDNLKWQDVKPMKQEMKDIRGKLFANDGTIIGDPNSPLLGRYAELRDVVDKEYFKRNLEGATLGAGALGALSMTAPKEVPAEDDYFQFQEVPVEKVAFVGAAIKGAVSAPWKHIMQSKPGMAVKKYVGDVTGKNVASARSAADDAAQKLRQAPTETVDMHPEFALDFDGLLKSRKSAYGDASKQLRNAKGARDSARKVTGLAAGGAVAGGAAANHQSKRQEEANQYLK